MHFCRGNLAEIDALFCDVLVALWSLLLLLDGLIPLFRIFFVFLIPPNKRFF